MGTFTWPKPGTSTWPLTLLTRFITRPVTRSTATTFCPDLGDFRLKDVTPGHVDRWYLWVLEASEEAALRRQTIAVGSPAWRRLLRSWAIEEGMEVSATGRIPERVHVAWEQAGSPPLEGRRLRPVEQAGRAQTANAYKLLRAIMAAAVEAGLILANPCKVRNGSASPRSQTPPASPNELARITAAMPDRYQVAVLVTAYGALRAGEVFGLARRHIDVERGAVIIDRSVSYLPGKGRSFGTPKTEAGRRRVHLPETVMHVLAAHMEKYVGASPESLIFCTSHGTPLHSSNRTAIFRRAALAAGRPDMRFHDLRHSGATLAAQHGASLPELMQRLGHTTPRASLIYLHASENADQELAKRPSAAIAGAAS